MDKNVHWLRGLVDILRATTGDLRQLAEIAGENPRTLFIGTALDGADLRGQDLRGMRFTHLDLSKVRHDAETKLDSPDPAALIGYRRSSFSADELLKCARGELFGPSGPLLPAPPMLLFDRIASIDNEGGAYGQGFIEAELEVAPDDWFFASHYLGDPIMPSSLAIDALSQLLGFYLGWMGANGHIRSLGVGNVQITGQVSPESRKLTYRVELRRIITRRLVMAIGNGSVDVDGNTVIEANDIRVGLFEISEV